MGVHPHRSRHALVAGTVRCLNPSRGRGRGRGRGMRRAPSQLFPSAPALLKHLTNGRSSGTTSEEQRVKKRREMPMHIPPVQTSPRLPSSAGVSMSGCCIPPVAGYRIQSSRPAPVMAGQRWCREGQGRGRGRGQGREPAARATARACSSMYSFFAGPVSSPAGGDTLSPPGGQERPC